MKIFHLAVNIIIPIVILMNTDIIVMMALASLVIMMTILLDIVYDYGYCSQYYDYPYITTMTILITTVVLNNNLKIFLWVVLFLWLL